MGLRNVGAAMLAGAALVTAVAGPAHATPQDDQRAEQRAKQLDEQFLKAIQDKRLYLKSDAYALDLAHSTCDVLNRGGTVDDALRHVKNSTEWKSLDNVGAFAGLAVQAYCPRTK